ncbi:DGQHR domain-containing protein [Azospirillum sp. 11R-A]|uniref:DGQHR domain-containing protein n=1 Tax=Azospirillum sp. 11R-A TaxID=3111634 RepID=UPI003C180906
MAEFPNGLVRGEEAKKIYVQRAKGVDEKTVTAAKKEALATKVQGEEQDGWIIAKRNKTSVRMSKPKLVDRQLEDDVWCLLHRLGFTEFNADRNFTIKLGPTAPGRQIDIFAKDDETVFIVECTHAQEAGSKSVKGLIDKINGMRDDIIKTIHAHYGKEPKLKVKFCIATRNVDWRKADKIRAAESRIAVLTEQDIAYYTKLTDHVREAARYQFLARYLKGEGVDGLRTDVPATKGNMGGTTFYNFLISPYELLKIAYISHKATGVNDLDTYQRMVKPSRLKAIANYIDEDGQFPTNIVINFKTKHPLEFQKGPSQHGSFGTLKLPGLYGSAWVIDGQHRLYGFAFAKKGKKHLVPVLAYENLPSMQERKLFIDINSEQVKVPKSLLREIYAELDADSDDVGKRLEAQYPRIALRLDEMPGSPILDRLQTSSKPDKDHRRCLTLTSLAEGIKENRFLGTVVVNPGATPMIQPGYLSDLSGDFDTTAEKAADVIAGYFKMFADGVQGHWDLGAAKGGFLATNNGIRALLRLLKEILTFIDHNEHVKLDAMEAKDILEKVEYYIEPVIDFFKNAGEAEVQNFRSRQALDGVKKNCLGMMGIIAESKPEFSTVELKEYMDSRDKEGTSVARDLIDKINAILFEDVLTNLQKHYGTAKENWWWKGIPQSTREKCDGQVNRDNGEKERWRYLSLADYQGIVVHNGNWPLFEGRYDFDGKGNKGDRVRWIGRLCKVRQTTHHPEKGLISKDDVAFVKATYAMVKQKIQKPDETDAA